MFSAAKFDRSPLAALVRRYRRPLAAVSAGLAVLLTLSSLKAPAPVASGLETGPSLAFGEVAAPITLASADIAASLQVGDIIDVVAIPNQEAGISRVVARGARVLKIGTPDGFGASASALVVIALPEPDALAIADATADSDLTALIH